jgi:hypothetical protein
MKNILVIFIVSCVLISACKSSKKVVAGSPIDLVQLKNYFPKIVLPLADTFSHFVISDSTVFFNQFSADTTMRDTIAPLNFTTKIILAIQGTPTTQKTIILFNNAELIGKELNVYYTTSIAETLSFAMTPAAVASIPKGYAIENVNFYRNKVKVFTIPL